MMFLSLSYLNVHPMSDSTELAQALLIGFGSNAISTPCAVSFIIYNEDNNSFNIIVGGSMVECLTQDQGVEGLSRIGVTALCP